MKCILEYTLEIVKHTVKKFSLASSLPSTSNTECKNSTFILQKMEFPNSGRLPQSIPTVVTPQSQLNSMMNCSRAGIC